MPADTGRATSFEVVRMVRWLPVSGERVKCWAVRALWMHLRYQRVGMHLSRGFRSSSLALLHASRPWILGFLPIIFPCELADRLKVLT